MTRRLQWLVALLSLLSALGSGAYAYAEFDRLIASATVVVPAVSIPPYTLVTPGLLTTKEVPRPILNEDVYTSPEELAGRITTVPLAPGMLVYRAFAVDPAAFRLTDDPALEVVSFPVDPARAVGGQVRVGQWINVYRVALARPDALGQALSAEALLRERSAAAEVLAAAVPVVDVRSDRGERVTEPIADPRRSGASSANARTVPLQILTVAVPPEVARAIIALVVEERAEYALWVSLAPLAVEVSP